MMRVMALRVAAIAICLLLAAAPAVAKKPQVIRASGGSNIHPLGIVVDASYDPRLDGLIPGYKVVNVAIVNQSFNILYLHPEKDRWEIKLADGSKPITALHNLRSQDPKAWGTLPERAKGLVAYPLVLPIGGREVFDLFVPDTVDVGQFTEVDIFIKSMNIRLEVLARS